MKAWTLSELDNVIASLAPLVGLRLQEVQTGESDCVLGFYSSSGVLWLWIDLNATRPSLLPWTALPLRPQVQKTPLQLFLRAHFTGRVLGALTRVTELGRVVLLRFGDSQDSGDKSVEIEIRLFPHGRNLIVRAAGKQISWQRPSPLQPLLESTSPIGQVRSLEDLRQEWLRSRGSANGKPLKNGPGDIKFKLERELEKKQKALAKVREELQRKQDLPWRQIGDWLKNNQSLAVPPEWNPFVDRRRKLAWNIEQCFTKAREGDGKVFGTEKRVQALVDEIGKLQDRLSAPASLLVRAAEPVKHQPTLAKIEAQGRTLHLSDGTTAVMGKSAADNLKILRKARAWDLWFHMRDYPSSHAVLFRNKSVKVTDERIMEVAQWFVRHFLGPKAAQHAGEKFDIVMTECRFVRPVKGDKIGRVTFHDERVLIYQFPG